LGIRGIATETNTKGKKVGKIKILIPGIQIFFNGGRNVVRRE
jgi:hypothetical protein